MRQNREKPAIAGSWTQDTPGLSANALPLSHNSWTTTSPNPLYVLHKWYWMPRLHTWQALCMCYQNSIRSRPENSIHQERTRAELFTHSKCSEHLAWCYEAKIEESEKANSHQESNPGHPWLEPPVLCHSAISKGVTCGRGKSVTCRTTGKSHRTTTSPHNPLHMYCTSGTECLSCTPDSHSVSGRPENSLHQERTSAECFTHSKWWEHLASWWK